MQDSRVCRVITPRVKTLPRSKVLSENAPKTKNEPGEWWGEVGVRGGEGTRTRNYHYSSVLSLSPKNLIVNIFGDKLKTDQ